MASLTAGGQPLGVVFSPSPIPQQTPLCQTGRHGAHHARVLGRSPAPGSTDGAPVPVVSAAAPVDSGVVVGACVTGSGWGLQMRCKLLRYCALFIHPSIHSSVTDRPTAAIPSHHPTPPPRSGAAGAALPPPVSLGSVYPDSDRHYSFARHAQLCVRRQPKPGPLGGCPGGLLPRAAHDRGRAARAGAGVAGG